RVRAVWRVWPTQPRPTTTGRRLGADFGCPSGHQRTGLLFLLPGVAPAVVLLQPPGLCVAAAAVVLPGSGRGRAVPTPDAPGSGGPAGVPAAVPLPRTLQSGHPRHTVRHRR